MKIDFLTVIKKPLGGWETQHRTNRLTPRTALTNRC